MPPSNRLMSVSPQNADLDALINALQAAIPPTLTGDFEITLSRKDGKDALHIEAHFDKPFLITANGAADIVYGVSRVCL